MFVWTVLVTLGVFVCVLSAWMSRLGNGGVSKGYAPITAFHAQSPDHIPTCYLTVHLTVCLSILPTRHSSASKAPHSPRVQSAALSDSRRPCVRIPLTCSCDAGYVLF